MSGPQYSAAIATSTTTSSTASPLATTIPPATTMQIITTRSPMTTVPASALEALTTAIYGLQRQMGDFATRVANVEDQPLSSPTTQQLLPYGMLGYGGIASLPPLAPVTIIHTTAQGHPPLRSTPMPIHQIPFPHSPSPIPSMASAMHMPPPLNYKMADPACAGVSRFHKLSFPTFDGKDDPLGWLNRYEQFFRGQSVAGFVPHNRECSTMILRPGARC